MRLDAALRKEYLDRWRDAKIKPDKLATVDLIISAILRGRSVYESISRRTRVPWYAIAVIHSLEGSLNFATHLHNGDSLKRRTINVPKGRPTGGNPPFTFVESAVDALEYDGFTSWRDWSVAGLLYKLETYNGMGYQLREHDRELPSPYLWSFATLPGWDGRGKFTSDKVYDPHAVSDQAGAAVLLLRMSDRGIITLEGATRAAIGFTNSAADGGVSDRGAGGVAPRTDHGLGADPGADRREPAHGTSGAGGGLLGPGAGSNSEMESGGRGAEDAAPASGGTAGAGAADHDRTAAAGGEEKGVTMDAKVEADEIKAKFRALGEYMLDPRNVPRHPRGFKGALVYEDTRFVVIAVDPTTGQRYVIDPIEMEPNQGETPEPDVFAREYAVVGTRRSTSLVDVLLKVVPVVAPAGGGWLELLGGLFGRKK